jgi:hypothetical protein
MKRNNNTLFKLIRAFRKTVRDLEAVQADLSNVELEASDLSVGDDSVVPDEIEDAASAIIDAIRDALASTSVGLALRHPIGSVSSTDPRRKRR